MFINALFSDPVYFLAVVIAVGFSVCLHEFFHAYTALKCGDSTAADMGYLTLNPLKQMGVISLIMLLLLGLCWGAVPVDPNRLTRSKRVLVSLAGPLTNLFLSFTGVIAGSIFLRLRLEPGVFFFIIFAGLNMVLFCINIAPVPGFDGGNILMELIGKNKMKSSELGKGFMIGAFLLLFYLIDYIFEWSFRITETLIAVLGGVV